MSCITVTMTPQGGIWCTTSTVGGIFAKATPTGGIHCRMWQECSTNIAGKKYLEIEPTIVWVLNGWTSNEVYSNTTWNVD